VNDESLVGFGALALSQINAELEAMFGSTAT
jgi:hypothetical protein